VVLFGIATSVELFHERLSRDAIRCLKGAQFDVEQTGKTLQTIFNSVILDLDIPLRIGASFMSSLLDRQHEHVQSLQTFISALKVCIF
jgi:origin recognition complex subunit 3